jgi:CRP-like cAMP-binding protein
MTQALQNRLLEMMPLHDLVHLRPHLHEVRLNYRMPLCEANEPIGDVYFPISGVAYLVNIMDDGFATEVGTVGNEGVVGIPIVLGDTVGPTNVYIQVPGVGLRLNANILKDLLERSTGARTLMLHYVHAFFNQVAQSAACNTAHKVEQRCCRWLLMTHDRMQSDKFPLTQEFLAMMLGVRRTTVSAVAQQLKVLKLVQYDRGHATILDRAGLERHSCECYSVSKREFDRLLGPAKGLVQPRPTAPSRHQIDRLDRTNT